jgi:hypothetical protein
VPEDADMNALLRKALGVVEETAPDDAGATSPPLPESIAGKADAGAGGGWPVRSSMNDAIRGAAAER